MNLTIRVVDEVKSSRLANALTVLVLRLEEALESMFLKKVREKGFELAEKLARIAYSWGNRGSLHWIEEKAFIIFLGVSFMNMPRMYGCST